MSLSEQPRGQRIVRVNALEKTLEDFNVELGKKTAILIQQYHIRHVKPLEDRLMFLEYERIPWWTHAWDRLTLWWSLRKAPTVATPPVES